MVIVETSVFTRLIQDLMDDDDYQYLQEALVSRPDLGAIIKCSGGLRKLRWSLKGRGKSGGVRVIYFWAVEEVQIRMLYAYAKGTSQNLTKAQLSQLKAIVERW